MGMHKSGLFCAALFLLIFGVDARAGTIYSHGFSGTSANPLNGVVPDVDAYAGTPGAHAWTAHARFLADGSMSSANSIGSAALPFVPEAGNVYTLKMDVNFTSNTFLEFGFEGINNIDQTPSPNQAFAWFRVNGVGGPPARHTIQVFTGPSTIGEPITFGGQNHLVPAGPLQLKVVLETTGPNWRATWSANDTFLAGHTYATNPTINFIGIGNASSMSIDNFSLTSVPEPAGATLMLLGATLLGRRAGRAR
jgi:hypothetical protein